jgi:glycosyltransferase involved in cell wall biosynthesis
MRFRSPLVASFPEPASAGPRFLVWFWSSGGGARVAVGLARRLAMAFGRDRVALSLREGDPALAAAQGAGLTALAAPVRSDRHRPLATLIALGKSLGVLNAHIRETRADVVILAMNFAAAPPLAALMRKPLVYLVHDPAPHPGDYAPVWQRVSQGLLLRRADAVVALSAYAGRALARMVDASRLHVVPLSALFEPVAAPRLALEDRPVRLLLLGRLLPYKGLDLLADALAALATRRDWRLTIAGFGPAAPAHDRLRALGQLDCFQEEWLSDAQIQSLIDAHDVLLAPYVSATQSGVVCEAIARAMPVVATPVGALSEQIGHGEGGWLAASATPQAFAAALTAMLNERAHFAGKSAGALAIAERAWRGDYWSCLAKVR